MDNGYSGRLLETDIVGKRQKPTRDYLNRLKQTQGGEGRYVDFEKSFSLVRDTYQGDPTNPDKDLPRDLLFDLRERFGLNDEVGDRFKFYSAIGTPLDFFHGADGWFEFTNPSGRVVVVTIDATQNLSAALSGEKNKADLVVVDTEDRRFVGRVDVFKKDYGETLVVYCPVSDPTSETYVDSLDLLAVQLEKIFKSKGIIVKKAA